MKDQSFWKYVKGNKRFGFRFLKENSFQLQFQTIINMRW